MFGGGDGPGEAGHFAQGRERRLAGRGSGGSGTVKPGWEKSRRAEPGRVSGTGAQAEVEEWGRAGPVGRQAGRQAPRGAGLLLGASREMLGHRAATRRAPGDCQGASGSREAGGQWQE